MAHLEISQPFSLYCDVGKTQATVLVPAGTDMRDNVDSHVVEPCQGCKKWSPQKIAQVERDIKVETMENFGSDDENLTGIRDGRVNQLSQLLVDFARFKRGEPHKLVVGMCTPIGTE